VDFEEFTKEGGDEDDARSSWILSGISGKCIGVTIGFGFNKNERAHSSRKTRANVRVLNFLNLVRFLKCRICREFLKGRRDPGAEMIRKIKGIKEDSPSKYSKKFICHIIC